MIEAIDQRPQDAELGQELELGHGDRGGQQDQEGQPDSRIGPGGDGMIFRIWSLSWPLLT